MASGASIAGGTLEMKQLFSALGLFGDIGGKRRQGEGK
jgi:hypothetical protein